MGDNINVVKRGVRGKAVARQLVSNKANFGISQALRSRGLTQAGYMAKQSNEDVNRQLKGMLNQSFGKVALQPQQDITPPPPVLQNPGMLFRLGMGQALGEGIMGNKGLMEKWNNSKAGGGPGKTPSAGTGTSMGQNYGYVTDPTFGHQIRTFQGYY